MSFLAMRASGQSFPLISKLALDKLSTKAALGLSVGAGATGLVATITGAKALKSSKAAPQDPSLSKTGGTNAPTLSEVKEELTEVEKKLKSAFENIDEKTSQEGGEKDLTNTPTFKALKEASNEVLNSYVPERRKAAESLTRLFNELEASVAAANNTIKYDISELQATQTTADSNSRQTNTPISVDDRSVTKVAAELSIENNKVCVLNLAHPEQAGGGFLQGGRAQEQVLCQETTLFPALLEHVGKDDKRLILVGADRVVNENTKINILYTKGVKLFSDNNQSCDIDVVSASAFNLNPEDNNNHFNLNKVKTTIDSKEFDIYQEKTKQMIRAILNIAKNNGATHLVLGALGCGVFKNDPSTIADLFSTVISSEFPKSFETITFSIFATEKEKTNKNSPYCVFSKKFPQPAEKSSSNAPS